MSAYYWTPERIVAAVRTWEREHGRTPRKLEWEVRNRGPLAPHASTVRSVFGTWNAAIAAAGFVTLAPCATVQVRREGAPGGAP